MFGRILSRDIEESFIGLGTETGFFCGLELKDVWEGLDVLPFSSSWVLRAFLLLSRFAGEADLEAVSVFSRLFCFLILKSIGLEGE